MSLTSAQAHSKNQARRQTQTQGKRILFYPFRTENLEQKREERLTRPSKEGWSSECVFHHLLISVWTRFPTTVTEIYRFLHSPYILFVFCRFCSTSVWKTTIKIWFWLFILNQQTKYLWLFRNQNLAPRSPSALRNPAPCTTADRFSIATIALWFGLSLIQNLSPFLGHKPAAPSRLQLGNTSECCLISWSTGKHFSRRFL